ncbi:hypothetical protein SAMN05661091_1782 [Paenibacillus uliginis N3/975]|uniref:Uncharacterized protein n=1 Tax=Paenibacillus uliginis N3/975 TaxID=1313296 RepID=A0A1X7H5E9_9BACL|nr:hypothetical protein SAMN05661091_1782 [Paenibacillus uliginis N3/975]
MSVQESKSRRFKQIRVILLIMLSLIIIEQIPLIQRITAISTSQVYVYVKYGNDLSFKEIEYVPQFGDYFVSYENKGGEKLSFIVSPHFNTYKSSFLNSRDLLRK